MNDLEGVLDDTHGHQLLAVVASMHHEGVGEPLNDWALREGGREGEGREGREVGREGGRGGRRKGGREGGREGGRRKGGR